MPHPAVLNPPSFMFDNPASSSSAFQVEDFFNLDLLAGNDDARSSTSALNNNSNTSANSNGNSTSASSSSRASSEAGSDSPAGSFSHLQTPPQSEALTSFDLMNFDSSFGGLQPIEEESIFTVGGHSGASDFFKPGTDPLAGLSHSPFDLFASFDAQLNGVNNSNSATSDTNSSSSASAPATSASASFSFGAIDPQLTRTPATPTTTTDDRSENGADQDSDDESSHKLIISPIKVGGKGKARRGTLHSGGVSKKPALPGPQSIFGSIVSNEGGPSAPMGRGLGQGKSFAKEKISRGQDQDDDDKDDDADDWRPSPEEYAKMSSKEKRQLRNKISARNFRIRRKEYIATLEGDIADRDRLIDAIRSELGSTKSENNALRQEVEALKKAILEGRASPMLPPPAPLSPLSPLSSFATLPGPSSSNASAGTSSKSNNNIIKPNTHKDLPTSPRLGASPFWGGQAGGFGSFGGGITPVHTAIIPETGASVFGVEDRQKENINPALNIPAQHQPQQQQVLSQVLAQLYGNSNNVPKNDSTMHAAPNSFDSFGFADVNPFTLKTLDVYRMQLWERAAAQVQQAQRERVRSAYTQSPAAATGYPSPPHSSPAHSPNPNTALSGLASSLRPQYFASSNSRTSPSSPTSTAKPFGSLLSNKGMPYGHSAHHGLPTPPASPRLSEKDRSASASASQQQVRRAMQQKEREQREQAQTHAVLASLASHTLLQKLGVAFWEAFSFTSGSAFGSAPGTRNWDSEKVRRVLDGSAVLKVVDVDRSSPSSSGSADTLAESMRGLSLDNRQKEKQNRQDTEKKGLFARMSNTCSGCSSKKGEDGERGDEKGTKVVGGIPNKLTESKIKHGQIGDRGSDVVHIPSILRRPRFDSNRLDLFDAVVPRSGIGGKASRSDSNIQYLDL
ncbi:hypothetical protein ACEPAF_2349 [Sanghuangporus sanghuang]